MPAPQPNGKDLQDFLQLPSSPLVSHVARAAEAQQTCHYVLSALEPTRHFAHQLSRRQKGSDAQDPMGSARVSMNSSQPIAQPV
jgi:hypothetical protein